jgi:hypothetical protein
VDAPKGFVRTGLKLVFPMTQSLNQALITLFPTTECLASFGMPLWWLDA